MSAACSSRLSDWLLDCFTCSVAFIAWVLLHLHVTFDSTTHCHFIRLHYQQIYFLLNITLICPDMKCLSQPLMQSKYWFFLSGHVCGTACCLLLIWPPYLDGPPLSARCKLQCWWRCASFAIFLWGVGKLVHFQTKHLFWKAISTCLWGEVLPSVAGRLLGCGNISSCPKDGNPSSYFWHPSQYVTAIRPLRRARNEINIATNVMEWSSIT